MPQIDESELKELRKTCGSASGLAEILVKKTPYCQDSGGRLYVYKDGVYKPGGEKNIRRQIVALLRQVGSKEDWTLKIGREVEGFIRDTVPELRQRPPLYNINLKNGIYDLYSGLLVNHTPALLSTIQLPVTYDPDAKCPAWDKFISEVFCEDAVGIVWELAAWLMVPCMDIQKAILLFGEGANGKSTCLKGLIAFLGRNNISSMSLQRIEVDRFASSRLINKLANICPDLPDRKLETTSMFKAITGGDTIIAEYKFGDSFDVNVFSRLIFSMNELPRTNDYSEGFYRRLIILAFNKRFTADPQKGKQLDYDLSRPEELSGVLNKALKVLAKVLNEGLTISPSMRDSLDEYRLMSDPVAAWLDSEIETDLQGFIPRDKLYKAYCEDVKIGLTGSVLSRTSFRRALARHFPHVEDRKKVIDGVLVRVYHGVSFQSESLHDL